MRELISLQHFTKQDEIKSDSYDCSPFMSIFFVFFLIIGLYFLMNLVLAVAYTHFQERTRRRLENIEVATTEMFSEAFGILSRLSEGKGTGISKDVWLEFIRRNWNRLGPRIAGELFDITCMWSFERGEAGKTNKTSKKKTLKRATEEKRSANASEVADLIRGGTSRNRKGEFGAKLQLKAFEDLLRILDSYDISKRPYHASNFTVDGVDFHLDDEDEAADGDGNGKAQASLARVTSAAETVDDIGALTWGAVAACTESHARSEWRIAVRSFFRNDYVANGMDGLIL